MATDVGRRKLELQLELTMHKAHHPATCSIDDTGSILLAAND